MQILAEDIAETLPTAKAFFVSSEAFSGHIAKFPHLPEDIAFYRIAPQQAQFLADALGDLPVSVQVVVYLRQQADFIESAYRQIIHQGSSTSLDDYLADIDLGVDFRWDTLVDSYAAIYGQDNVHVVNFDEARKTTGLWKPLEDIIGHPVAGDDLPKGNISYSPAALELARHANPLLTDRQRVKMRQFMQRPDLASGPVLPLIDAAMRARIYDIYRPFNLALAEKYGIALTYPDGLSAPSLPSADLKPEPDQIVLAKALAALQELQVAHDRLKGMIHAQNRETQRLKDEIVTLKQRIP